MRKLLLLAIIFATPLMANKIDVSPTGQVYTDRYGSAFEVPANTLVNRRPTKQELGIDTDHNLSRMVNRK